MFIRSIDITNYKLFKDTFSVDFNVPDGATPGSGLTVFCGENGNGKSSVLESIALGLQDYRSENFSIEHITDLTKKVIIDIYASTPFEVKSFLPRKIFNATGFSFVANKRQRASGNLYGSLVVSGRKLISVTEEADYELRCEGLTPFGAPRYEQPSLLFLDRNRIYQTRKGSTTSTNFDYLLERLSSSPQCVEGETPEYVLPDDHPLKKAFTDFESVFHIPLRLYKMNPEKQMEHAFVASYTDNNIIKLDSLGSGYEMFFSILWAVYRSLNDKKSLIILLDEPELHLHPSMQQRLVKLLAHYSDKVQIIISTHSPLFIKQLYGITPKIHILEKQENIPTRKEIKEQKIKNYLSLNEVNFMAFGLYTEEYFNELYETLYRKTQQIDNTITSYNFDEKFFVNQKGIIADKPYRANSDNKKVSYITFVRNVIHHRVDYTKAGLEYTDDEFKSAIDTMRSYL
ncbi:MAG: AAA family ATPase [Alphaproteobacteria bacterium]